MTIWSTNNDLTNRQRKFIEDHLLPYSEDMGYENLTRALKDVLERGVYETWNCQYFNAALDEYKGWCNRFKIPFDEEFKPLTQTDRAILENHLIPLTYDIPFRGNDFRPILQKILRIGQYNEMELFLMVYVNNKRIK